MGAGEDRIGEVGHGVGGTHPHPALQPFRPPGERGAVVTVVEVLVEGAPLQRRQLPVEQGRGRDLGLGAIHTLTVAERGPVVP